MKYSAEKVEVNVHRLRVFTRQGRTLASTRVARPSVGEGGRALSRARRGGRINGVHTQILHGTRGIAANGWPHKTHS